jgi:hypothetical protein
VQRVGIEPEALERVHPDVRDERVGAVEQLVRKGDAVGRGEVDDDAALRAVVHLERRVEGHIAAEHLGEAARRVAGGWLDLDHVGTPVGEHTARRGAGHPHAQLDNPHTVQRSAHEA